MSNDVHRAYVKKNDAPLCYRQFRVHRASVKHTTRQFVTDISVSIEPMSRKTMDSSVTRQLRDANSMSSLAKLGNSTKPLLLLRAAQNFQNRAYVKQTRHFVTDGSVIGPQPQS